MKGIFQIEREEIDEAETHEELKEVTGQSDPLNLIFSYFDKLEKARTRNQLRKNEKLKLKLQSKKVTGYNTNLI